jgi:hypothetical protein
MSGDTQTNGKNPGRPKVRERPDLRITIRLRYHCDEDLIEALEQVPSRGVNAFVRRAMREWIKTQSEA